MSIIKIKLLSIFRWGSIACGAIITVVIMLFGLEDLYGYVFNFLDFFWFLIVGEYRIVTVIKILVVTVTISLVWKIFSSILLESLTQRINFLKADITPGEPNLVIQKYLESGRLLVVAELGTIGISVLFSAPVLYVFFPNFIFTVVMSFAAIWVVVTIIWFLYLYYRPEVTAIYYPDTKDLAALISMGALHEWKEIFDENLNKIPQGTPDYEIATYLRLRILHPNERVQCRIPFDSVTSTQIINYISPSDIIHSYDKYLMTLSSPERLG